MRFQNKLFLLFATYSVLLVLAIVVFVQLGLKQGLLDYVNARAIGEFDSVISALQDEYEQTGSWSQIRSRPRRFRQIIESNSGVSLPGPGPGGPARRGARENQGPRFGPPPRGQRPRNAEGPLPGKEFSPPYVLLDTDKSPIMGPPKSTQNYSLAPLMSQGQLIGYFGIRSQERLTEGYEIQFTEQFQDYTIWLALIILLVSALVASPISRHITRPLRQITAKIENVKNGHYNDLIVLKRKDEIGQLSNDIDLMAEKLAYSQTARERWLADVSHELRTPLAVLMAQIESIEDGIRQADDENLRAMRNEIVRCQNLMADLHEIAMPEPAMHRYLFDEVDICALVQQCVDRHAKRFAEADLAVSLKFDEPVILADADSNRLLQLLDNLINNVFNYAQAKHLVIAVHIRGDSVIAVLEDDGVGVEDDEYDALFSYQFRGRRQKHKVAGSGIGLALCSKIAAAHNGNINATPSPLGGLRVTLTLDKV